MMGKWKVIKAKGSPKRYIFEGERRVATIPFSKHSRDAKEIAILIAKAPEQQAEIAALKQQLDEANVYIEELKTASHKLQDDLLERSTMESDGTRVVNVGNGAWSRFCDALDSQSPKQSLETGE